MPVLIPGSAAAQPSSNESLKQNPFTREIEGADRALFSVCANPRCKAGWLKVWRSRTRPVFEGGWCCSPECTQVQVAWALRREIEMLGRCEESHSHRIPLGLLMLEQGWITASQLREALSAQRAAGTGRVGEWLSRRCGVSEHLVTRALALQWRCPVLPMDGHDPEATSAFLPRLFVDAFGALPLRSAVGRLLYVGFEEKLDAVLALALERMSGLHVENGLVPDSLFRPAHARMLQAKFPRVELIEALSEQILARELARRVEKARPVECRIARVHDFFWMRLWKNAQRGPLPEADSVEDLICTSITPLSSGCLLADVHDSAISVDIENMGGGEAWAKFER